jgi:putative transcriptional regulator
MTPLGKTDILLLRYAAGTLGTGASLVVVTILVFNGDARRKVAAFEAVGGHLIQEQPPASVSPECLEIVLQKIEIAPRTESPLERFLDLFSRF